MSSKKLVLKISLRIVWLLKSAGQKNVFYRLNIVKTLDIVCSVQVHKRSPQIYMQCHWILVIIPTNLIQ